MLCRKFGVDVKNFAIDRIPEELAGKSPKEIRAELSKTRSAMSEIGSRVSEEIYRRRADRNKEQERCGVSDERGTLLFRSKKQEIEDRVAKLTEEIKGLQPEKEQTSNEDYSVKLLELRERLKEYTGFDYSVIPESIVEAFIERIWVSKDEFRWYLRTGNNADGEFDPDDHIKIGAFTLTIDDAKKYIYSFSTRRRVYKWADLNVSVWI